MVIAEDSLEQSVTANDSGGAGTPERTGRPWWPFVAGAGAIFLAVSLLTPAGRHQWAVSIVRQPTRYTTLSFRHAAALPHDVNAGARVHLSFTVANHEGRRMHYPYLVSITANPADDQAANVLRRASLTVPAGGQRTESVTVKPRCANASCRLQVSLPGHPETIDAILNVHRPKG
jgi:hypothetical protein